MLLKAIIFTPYAKKHWLDEVKTGYMSEEYTK